MSCIKAQDPSVSMPLVNRSVLMAIAQYDDGLIAIGERGHVLKSSDGGENWFQFDNIPVDIMLTDIATVGQNIWIVGHDMTIIHSGDSGSSWQVQFYDPNREQPLLSVDFTDKQEGFAVGAYGVILRTNDGGKSWQDELISEELDYHLNDMVISKDVIFIAGEAGYGFRSMDKGKTFEAVELPYEGSMFGISLVNQILITYGLRGHIQVSEDFGSSWRKLDFNTNVNSLFAAERIDKNHLLLAGANATVLILNLKNFEIKKAPIDMNETGDFISDMIKVSDKLVTVGENGIHVKALSSAVYEKNQQN